MKQAAWRWAGARILFHLIIAFTLSTVVGGIITVPFLIYCFFGDWRFWRYLRDVPRMYWQGWYMAYLVIRGENHGFMLGVPLFSPPSSVPDPGLVTLNGAWGHGSSCGNCVNCCIGINCPILHVESGLCRGYNSFFWRYFNCGRYPTQQSDIDYYGCPKWLLLPRKSEVKRGQAA